MANLRQIFELELFQCVANLWNVGCLIGVSYDMSMPNYNISQSIALSIHTSLNWMINRNLKDIMLPFK